jgi:apolipoprotein D and lipocalin family protein
VRFQDAASVSTAKYSVRDDGNVGVENTSFIGDERGYQIRGTAEPVSPSRTDRLRVSFGGFLSVIPTSKEGNYWVIDVDDEYEMALVGTPDRRYLWLLARDGETFDAERAQGLLDRAATLGFDTDQLSIADWSSRTMRTN